MEQLEKWPDRFKNGIEYYYQPLFNVQEQKIDKAEILIRLRDGLGGFYDAEQTVMAAQKLDLIDEMDRQTFIAACATVPEMTLHGIRQLSVNLSPAACHSPRLVMEVQRVLSESGISPGSICLEITEIAKLLDEERVFEPFQHLRDLGVKIALDDFGKGYSNLQRLINIPVHTIKLDKSLVWGMGGQRLATPVVENIIHFCLKNGIRVVAEGIETIAQVELLSRMGCHYLQGYYFGKPMRADELYRLLDAQNQPVCAQG